MSNKKLYDSKLTRKHGPNALPKSGKPRVATAPEKDVNMKTMWEENLWDVSK